MKLGKIQKQLTSIFSMSVNFSNLLQVSCEYVKKIEIKTKLKLKYLIEYIMEQKIK